ncbi:MAG: HAE1 family hydrophobic/amphiphilic exporter-1, partial [Lentimonas sp.]
MFRKIIHRPVLAIVISIVILFTGALAIKQLPISQFPQIAPTTVNIFISYPGASADVLIKSTLIPLEKSINGVQDMRYISSDATSAGEATIRVTFEPGVDPDQAVVRVKTRVDQVMPLLPVLVQREGVIISPIQPSMLMYVNLFSKDKNADQTYLYNYANVNMIPEIKRIKGIGTAIILGNRQYAMRVWLKPDRMRAYNIAADEVMKAMEEQSIIGRPGRLGQSSGINAQSLEYVLIYQDRYNEPKQYEEIIIRANEEGELIKLKDIAEVELGTEFMDIYSNLDGDPAAAIVLKQSVGSNASEVIQNVKNELEAMKEFFPPGMDYKISYDVSQFLDASIEQVTHTLRDAFILVAIVVFLFLGDWRSTLIPIIAVPVSLIGAFFMMQLFGLSINLITLFALVLAIGIVVDDAIVVVEAVHAKMEEENLSPYNAVKKVMGEISGAIIAITLVMISVFVPIAFMSGPVGTFYRQFSITMASAIFLSAIVALTLTPVLCAMLLKNNHGKPAKRNLLQRFLDGFNRGFEKLTGRYVKTLKVIVNRRVVTFGVLLLFCGGIFFESQVVPSGFIPGEDQGTIYAIIQTPPGATLERTNKVAIELQKICEEIEGVETVSALAGYEIMTEGRGSNAGTCLINLKPWSNRKNSVHDVIEELEEKTRDFGAIIEFFEPPAVPGFGSSGGFSLRLLDKSNTTDYQEFDKINQQFLADLGKRKELAGLFTFFAANYPQYELKIDNKLAMQKGVSIGKAMENLNILIGSTYEQGFIRFGNFFKVYTQAAPEYRRYPSDLENLFVKNESGEMVPYSSFMSLEKRQGPNEITRYNLYNSAAIQGTPGEGFTTGDAINAVKEVAKETLPRGYDIAWEGLSYDEAKRGNEAIYIFIVVIIFVYLVLAAQYESFLLPLAVILSLPIGIFGSFMVLSLMGLSNDIYAQVGLIMLVGLLGKNAVLIVEFAVQKHREGMSVFDAAIEGARVRFRPILMTSFAFIAGLVPLLMSHGAGEIGNKTIGGTALGGMLLGTILGVLIIPGLYYVFGKMTEGKKLLKEEETWSLSEEIVERTEEASKFREFLKKIGKKKTKMIVIFVIASATLTSCGIPKNLPTKEVNGVPKEFLSGVDTTNTANQIWKDFFKDSLLIKLIETALDNNQELNILQLEISQMNNEIDAKKGEYLPSLGLKGGGG